MNRVELGASSNQIITIYPNKNWFIYNAEIPLNFPPIRHYKVSRLNLPFSMGLKSKDIIMGGSYNIYCDKPLYTERCQIFENQYMPYEIDSKHIKVRNGVLLWPKLNLYAYTYIKNPQRVFIHKNGRFVVEFRFHRNHIDLFEDVGTHHNLQDSNCQ